MKRAFIIISVFNLLASTDLRSQQCLGGGCSNFGTQYPSSGAPYTPPTTWTTLINPATGNAALMNAGNYTRFNVTAGNTYEFSYCESYGGVSSGWDAQLTLYNEANLTTPLCFSTDACGVNGNAPYISWNATFTGTVRLLTTSYVNGPGGCQTNSGSPFNQLAYRRFTTGSCTTPGTPTNVVGTASGQTTANLSWSSGSPSGSTTVTYYWVVGTSSSVTYGNGVAQGSTTSTSATASGLTCNTNYYLRVYAGTSCNNTNSGYGTSSSFLTSSCTGSAVYGVDISHYNGQSVNWSTVYAAGKNFSFVKATEGVNTNDQYFSTNMTSSNPNGVKLGAYHLGRPDFSTNNTPTNEANHFISIAGSYFGNGYLPPALDMEPANIDAYIAQGHTYSELAQWINSFCVLVQAAGGKWPVLYTTKCYAANLRSFYGGAINSNIKLWIATNNITTDPAGNPGTSACSGNWTGWPWLFHQFFFPQNAGNNPVTYADPGMDQDFFNGTASDLNILIGSSGNCTDNFETNDNCTSATNVFASPLGTGTSNYTLTANIGYAGDQDWFKVNLASCGTLTVTLSNLPLNYDLEMYATGTTCTQNIIGGSYNNGTNTEQVVFVNPTSSPVTVFAKVYPFNSSTFNTSNCYALNFQWASSTCCAAPTTQAGNISFSSIGTSSMTTSWTNGNGSHRVVYINTSNSFTAPSNGADPTANTTYSGGQQCIYNGTGTNVTVSGLACATTYYYRVYEANCTGSAVVYNTTTSTANPSSQATSGCCSAPSVQASNISFSGVTPTSITTSWTNGNGSRRVVYINTSNSFTAPSNGTDPSANTTYSGGQQCVYNGTGTSTVINGLTCATTYYIRVYEGNCSATSSVYTTNTGTANPSSQATNACCSMPSQQSTITSFSAGANSITLNLAAGNGSRRVVKINTTNSFTAPANGTDPTANTTYGGGEQVIYNGTGNAVTVTNLAANTNYCFSVYEANCTGSAAIYNVSTSTNNPSCQSTTNPCSTPSVQSSILSHTAGTNSIQVNLSAGNGSRRLVKINNVNSFTPPSNGSDPTANTSYGGGEQVIYNGTGSSVTVTGLNASTNYCFRVYEANCTGTSSVYNINTATNNPSCQTTNSSCVAPTVQANSISFALIGTNSMEVSCLNGNGSRRIIKMNTINSFTDPANGTDPVANPVYSGSGEQVIYNGTANLVNVTNLLPNTSYCFKVYEANCIGSSSVYLTSSSTNNPRCQSTTASCPTLVQPTNLSPGTSVYPGPAVASNPTFNWTTSPSTVYRFELRIDPFGTSDIIASSCGITPPYTLTGINWQNGVTYRWTVKATDACSSGCLNSSVNYYFNYNASGCTVPTSQALISSSTPSANQITLNISPGNGSRRLVKINTTNSFTDPANGTDPSANSIYSGSGEQVVFNGNISSGIIGGLNPSTNYCFRIYEANCTGPQSIYLISNTSTLCQSTNVVTAIPDINGLEKFQVLPNPNNGQFMVKIKLNSIKDVSFNLLDIIGAKLVQTPVYRWSGSNQKEFNLSHLPAGIYLLETHIGKEHFINRILISH